MANHKSAIKRIRQNEKRRVRNQDVKTRIKSQVKRVRSAIEGGDASAAEENLKEAARLLEKAVSKGVLHKNNASRRVSRLTLAVNSAKASK